MCFTRYERFAICMQLFDFASEDGQGRLALGSSSSRPQIELEEDSRRPWQGHSHGF